MEIKKIESVGLGKTYIDCRHNKVKIVNEYHDMKFPFESDSWALGAPLHYNSKGISHRGHLDEMKWTNLFCEVAPDKNGFDFQVGPPIFFDVDGVPFLSEASLNEVTEEKKMADSKNVHDARIQDAVDKAGLEMVSLVRRIDDRTKRMEESTKKKGVGMAPWMLLYSLPLQALFNPFLDLSLQGYGLDALTADGTANIFSGALAGATALNVTYLMGSRLVKKIS